MLASNEFETRLANTIINLTTPNQAKLTNIPKSNVRVTQQKLTLV